MEPSAPASQIVSRALAAVGLLLFILAVGVTIERGEKAASARVLALQNAAEARSRSLSRYLDTAATAVKLTASNGAFQQVVNSDTSVAASALPEVNRALAFLHSMYPLSIGEACVINRSGAELARIVRWRTAGEGELATDEQDTPFFDLGIATPPGAAAHSSLYRSPDTDDWVTAVVTGLRSGNEHSFVHLELTLESVRQAVAAGDSGFEVNVVDVRTGDTILRGQEPVTAARESLVMGREYASIVGSIDSSEAGTLDFDGHTVGFRRIQLADRTVNDWALVVSDHSASGSVLAGLGADSLAFVLGGLLLCIVAARTTSQHRIGLRRAATTDVLTGLPNRAMLFGEASREVGRATPTQRVAVLLIDLDGFKTINDTLGHHEGDLVLAAVGPRLRSVLRPQDFIARLGGDEFVVVSPGLDAPGGSRVIADRLRNALAEPFVIGTMVHEVSASVGVAIAPTDGTDLDALLSKADVAMYAAKEQQVGVVEFDEALAEQTSGRIRLMNELQRGIEREELVLYYQPIIDLASGCLRGAEALVRWQHPTRGLVPPNEFIPVAELSPLIHSLTSWTLSTALGQQREWADQGHHLVVSVNVSARCLSDPDLTARVAGLLATHGVEPRFLKLEVTESAIMSDPVRSREVLGDLQALGVALSVDDFGTGHSSLAYLRDLSVDELKIDRSFVTELGSSAADEVIVRAIIDLARNLGLSMVAEGIEDLESLTRLRELGCTSGQGFLWSRPVPAAEFGALFTEFGELELQG